jgi:hypothetical protein
MECPQEISFNEITIISNGEEQNISQFVDFNEEIHLNLTKKQSLEEFLGMEDESTEISLILSSMDSGSITFTTESRPTLKEEDTESVSEILSILKKSPQSTKNKNSYPNEQFIMPFGGNIIRPVCVKKVSLSGKVLATDKSYPERVSKPVLRSSLTL